LAFDEHLRFGAWRGAGPAGAWLETRLGVGGAALVGAGSIGGRGWRSGDVGVSLAGGRGQAAGSIADAFRQTASFCGKNTCFPRQLDPLRQFIWRAEGGGAM